jgi:hypothetical protein
MRPFTVLYLNPAKIGCLMPVTVANAGSFPAEAHARARARRGWAHAPSAGCPVGVLLPDWPRGR